MSGPTEKEAEDPSMEDILASIRRILNDDEGPAAGGTGEADHGGGHEQASRAAGPHDSSSHSPAPPDDVFVLDQTMLIKEPAAMPPDDPFDFESVAQPPARPPPREPEPEDSGGPPEEALLNPSAAAAATASMGALVRVLNQQQMPVYRGGPTLEDIVRDEIRPLVKSWLDENLPPMVERMVRAEIARVTGAK